VAKLDRRNFIFTAGRAGAGAFAFSGLINRAAALSTNRLPSPSLSTLGYGPLLPTKSNNTRETLLALPKGFKYTVIGKTGATMSDGLPTPRAHDGMAAFKVNNQLRLVRNHEINNQVGKPGIAIGPTPYDPLAGGGTTTLVIDPNTREVIKDFVSLSGTLVNCAGGPTPWKSWITCEETLLGKELFRNASGQDQGGFAQHHGYCFEVDSSADRPVTPTPLKAMGRFQHEAIAVDPRSGIVYLTEDRVTAGFYRFLPRTPGQLAAGGRLQMLTVKNRPNFIASRQQQTGVAHSVIWVDITDPDPAEAGRDTLAVYKQGIAAGAATFARLEGCLYGNGRIYFTSTSGGDKQLGQVWEYAPSGRDQGFLTLLFEPTDPSVLNMPDNICLTAGGNLTICEDNGITNFIRVLNQKGELFDLAKNVFEGFETREFAGVTFSPDFKTLFANIQVPGVTLAIWGPWQSF
jgi:secreted PhoX family phosphatase